MWWCPNQVRRIWSGWSAHKRTWKCANYRIKGSYLCSSFFYLKFLHLDLKSCSLVGSTVVFWHPFIPRAGALLVADTWASLELCKWRWFVSGRLSSHVLGRKFYVVWLSELAVLSFHQQSLGLVGDLLKEQTNPFLILRFLKPVRYGNTSWQNLSYPNHHLPALNLVVLSLIKLCSFDFVGCSSGYLWQGSSTTLPNSLSCHVATNAFILTLNKLAVLFGKKKKIQPKNQPNTKSLMKVDKSVV